MIPLSEETENLIKDLIINKKNECVVVLYKKPFLISNIQEDSEKYYRLKLGCVNTVSVSLP